jgi:hypothetical protein
MYPNDDLIGSAMVPAPKISSGLSIRRWVFHLPETRLFIRWRNFCYIQANKSKHIDNWRQLVIYLVTEGWKKCLEISFLVAVKKYSYFPPANCIASRSYILSQYVIGYDYLNITSKRRSSPVTVAERSKACTIFVRSEAGIVDSNPTKGMDVWYVYVFTLFVLSCV